MVLKPKFKLILGFVLVLIIVLLLIWNLDFTDPNNPMVFGVTFSQPQAEYLGLDWRAVYIDMLDNLKIKNLRLIAYWNEIEKNDGQFDFIDLDWQMKEAWKRNAKVTLVIGQRLPHWPECHTPEWLSAYPPAKANARLLQALQKIIERYKNYPNLVIWQLENEPLVTWFGQCPKPDKEFLKQEITWVKSLDQRPIMITDSGELSTWLRTAHLGDYFGTTLYRMVWNKYLGYWNYDYLWPPAFYYFKAKLNYLPPSQVIIAELQAEAWLRENISLIPLEEQRHSMNPEQLQRNIDFAQRTGFKESYLWGVEYWYWLKEKHNDSSLYDKAKKIWQ